MTYIYERGVVVTTCFNIWILKKTPNISSKDKVISIEYFRLCRVSKLRHYGLSDKFDRYLVKFSFYIPIAKNSRKVYDFNGFNTKFNVTDFFWRFLNYFRDFRFE